MLADADDFAIDYDTKNGPVHAAASEWLAFKGDEHEVFGRMPADRYFERVAVVHGDDDRRTFAACGRPARPCARTHR
jgi:hypothetical protein